MQFGFIKMLYAGKLYNKSYYIGRRYLSMASNYYHNGVPVPRVTSILDKMIHEPFLLQWANNLGFKYISYRQEVRKAADIGSEAHSIISKILTRKEIKSGNLPFPVQAFLAWYGNILNYPYHKVIYSEKTFTCPLYGGTLDALLEVNGKRYLIDFKTSNSIRYQYLLQVAAYRYLMLQNGERDIDAAIILQLDKYSPNFEEYYIDNIQMLDEALDTFLKLVYGYNAIKRTETAFKSYFNIKR